MKLSQKIALAGAIVLGAVAPAFASVDPAISTAISGAQTDALTVITALTVMGAAVWGANYIRRKFFR